MIRIEEFAASEVQWTPIVDSDNNPETYAYYTVNMLDTALMTKFQPTFDLYTGILIQRNR